MRRWLSARDRAETLGIGFLAAFVFVLAAAPLFVSFLVSPEEIESGQVTLSEPCPHLATTGEPCRSCGMTRAFSAMSRGRVSAARDYNAAGPWLYALFVVCAGGSGFVLTLTALHLIRLRKLRNSAKSA